jgi:hypothetical protein
MRKGSHKASAGEQRCTLPDGRVMVRAANAVPQSHSMGKGKGILKIYPVTMIAPDGRSWEGWDWDLSELVIPPGAIRGRPHHQFVGYGGPMLWYEDKEIRCVQCGEEFTFWAKEQQYWYETLHFNHASHAIRCLECRKQRRSLKMIHSRLGVAMAGLLKNPNDAPTLLDAGTATLELHRRTGTGDLERAIGFVRKAARLSPQLKAAADRVEGALKSLLNAQLAPTRLVP